MKKIFKILLIILIVLAIPTIIIVVVLYVNEKYFLNKFLEWIPNGLNWSAIPVSFASYLAIINCFWRLILNVIDSINKHRINRRNKLNKIKVYDDEKNNYIYYDEKNNIIDLQFKSTEKVEPSKLIDMMVAELKNRITDFKK